MNENGKLRGEMDRESNGLKSPTPQLSYASAIALSLGICLLMVLVYLLYYVVSA